MKAFEAQEIVQKQKAYFRTGATRPLEFRLEALRQLKRSIQT